MLVVKRSVSVRVFADILALAVAAPGVPAPDVAGSLAGLRMRTLAQRVAPIRDAAPVVLVAERVGHDAIAVV